MRKSRISWFTLTHLIDASQDSTSSAQRIGVKNHNRLAAMLQKRPILALGVAPVPLN
jgi:hypothetical protein